MEKMFGASDNIILLNSSMNRFLTKKISETMNDIPSKILE